MDTMKSVAHSNIGVTHTVHSGDDLKTKTPNIGVFTDDVFSKRLVLHLTWQEARELSQRLEEFADLCEFG